MAGRSDVDILEHLLATEARLISIYEAGLRRDAIDPEFANDLLAQEREHARGLRGALADAGSRNPRASVPPPALGSALHSREAFARFALDMETEAVAAYVDAAATIHDPELRQALGSVLACESAHRVALRDLMGERPLVD
jgi:hypothetical protein